MDFSVIIFQTDSNCLSCALQQQIVLILDCPQYDMIHLSYDSIKGVITRLLPISVYWIMIFISMERSHDALV